MSYMQATEPCQKSIFWIHTTYEATTQLTSLWFSGKASIIGLKIHFLDLHNTLDPKWPKQVAFTQHTQIYNPSAEGKINYIVHVTWLKIVYFLQTALGAVPENINIRYT